MRVVGIRTGFGLHRLAATAALAAFLAGCASLPTDYPREPSTALSDTETTTLGRVIVPESARHPGLSGFHPLSNGLDAYAARLAFADAAERSLDVQYYLFHRDVTGYMLVERLLRAADRGVRVRVLVDDMDMGGRDAGLAALDLHPNIHIRLFNPFPSRSMRTLNFVTHLGTVTRRMHNKSFTIDNQVTIVGGRNVGDEYFEAAEGTNFGDMDVLAVGPVVREVSQAFDLYWNSPLAVPVSVLAPEGDPDLLEWQRKALAAELQKQATSPYADRLRSSDFVRALERSDLRLYWGQAQLLYDLPQKVLKDPGDSSTHMGPQLGAFLKQARSELLIVSPYFVPGDEAVAEMGRMVQRGVRVRILTNSLAATDVAAVHAGYARYREALLKAGVELYEMRPVPSTGSSGDRGKGSRLAGSSRASLHAKTADVDRERLFVGSANFDPRSDVLNTEMGIVFDNRELGEAFARWFDEDLQKIAYRVELERVEDPLTPPGDEYRLVWIEGRGEQARRLYGPEPEASAWRRAQVWLLSFLPIEGQL